FSGNSLNKLTGRIFRGSATITGCRQLPILKRAQQQRACNGQFRTPRRVIAAVELDKRYAENVSDVCLNVLPAGCEGTSSSSDGLVSFFRRSEKFLDFSGRPCGA